MADSFAVEWTYDALTAFWKGAQQALSASFFYPVTGPYMGDWHGYRAVFVSILINDQVAMTVYPILTSATGSLVSASGIMKSTQALSVEFHFYPSEAGEPSSWAMILEHWEEYFGGFIVDFLESMSESSVTVAPSVSIMAAADVIGFATMAVTVVADAEIFVFGMTCTGVMGDNIEGVQNSGGYYVPPSIAASIVVSQGSTALGRIADALEELALHDFDIAINNGQAIFSVKGKSTRTAP